jgi:hypothetical protein
VKKAVVVLILDPPWGDSQVVVGPECFLMDHEFLTCAKEVLERQCGDLEDADSLELWGECKKLKVTFGGRRWGRKES